MSVRRNGERSERRDKLTSTSSRTIERRPIRPLERQRMRSWLTDLLDKGECCQVAWLNKREKKFRVSWKHAAGQNWTRDMDASVFERWARHTGKFYDGDKPNPKKWKANFRCALNSLPDVDQERDQGIKRGLNAFKVYRFLDEKKPRQNRTKRTVSRRIKNNDNSNFDDDDDDDSDETMPDDGPEWKPAPRSQRYKTRMLALDSEGSEGSLSPQYHFGSSSNSSLGDSSDDVTDSTPSPLPHFDQICPIQTLTALRESRFTEAQAPLQQEDDLCSTSSGLSSAEEEVVEEMLLELGDDAAMLNNIFPNHDETGTTNSTTVESDLPLIFYSNPLEEGPNVIVQPSNELNTYDWHYTAISQL